MREAGQAQIKKPPELKVVLDCVKNKSMAMKILYS
jgi:hypothetical protein